MVGRPVHATTTTMTTVTMTTKGWHREPLHFLPGGLKLSLKVATYHCQLPRESGSQWYDSWTAACPAPVYQPSPASLGFPQTTPTATCCWNPSSRISATNWNNRLEMCTNCCPNKKTCFSFSHEKCDTKPYLQFYTFWPLNNLHIENWRKTHNELWSNWPEMHKHKFLSCWNRLGRDEIGSSDILTIQGWLRERTKQLTHLVGVRDTSLLLKSTLTKHLYLFRSLRRACSPRGHRCVCVTAAPFDNSGCRIGSPVVSLIVIQRCLQLSEAVFKQTICYGISKWKQDLRLYSSKWREEIKTRKRVHENKWNAKRCTVELKNSPGFLRMLSYFSRSFCLAPVSSKGFGFSGFSKFSISRSSLSRSSCSGSCRS